MAGIRHQMRVSQAMQLPYQDLPAQHRLLLIAHSAEMKRRAERQHAGFNKRALVRAAVLARLIRLQQSRGDGLLDSKILRMTDARQEYTISRRLSDGKCLRQWDSKTGDTRLDPDDAREEAARFSRRVSPAIEKLLEAPGARVTYAVFTMPNFAPGQLRPGCAKIYRRFSGFLRRCKRGKVPGCRGIRGAAVVLEAPLSAGRDWNVHLNVLLVHDGFIDYHALRAAWHWNVELRPVPPTQAGVASALREIIKYNVMSVAEKSAAKSASGASRAPALVDWTDPELWEWICAFRRFRRTRTYGVLYRLEKPPKLDLSEFVTIGYGTWSKSAGCFQLRFPLLDLIPEDKLNREGRRSIAQVRSGYARAGPGDLFGARVTP